MVRFRFDKAPIKKVADATIGHRAALIKFIFSSSSSNDRQKLV